MVVMAFSFERLGLETSSRTLDAHESRLATPALSDEGIGDTLVSVRRPQARIVGGF